MQAPSLGPDPALLARGTVLFQDGSGNLHVTAIVKTTYALRHDALADHATPLPLGDDVYGGDPFPGDRPRSLYSPSDLAPCKALADVVIVGRVYPRSPGAARQVIGFAVARGPDILLQKRLVASGERREADAAPLPIFPFPLAWERTWGGRDNPAGCDMSAGAACLPSIVDPATPGRPGGLGPIAPTWPSRIALLPKEHADALSADPQIISDDLDLRYFQCAPPDQQILRLLGGEQILLVGLHPDHSVMRCRLPALHAYARLEGPGVERGDVSLSADTLWIDAERCLACVTFRGSIQVATRREARALLDARPAWTVRAGMAPCANVEEVVGVPRLWSVPVSMGRSEKASPTVDPIAVHNHSGLAVGCFPWSLEPPKLRRVVAVKGTFNLSPDSRTPALSPEQDRLRGDEPASDDPGAELLHASDFVPFKAQADVLLRGTAHGIGERTTALVQLKVGAVAARLVALGPRSWDANGIPGAPGPFISVPLRWEHGFGGAGFAANPAGTGFAVGTPPPRIEDPDRLIRSRADRPTPAAFGPIAPGWQARRALLGTYDRSWREERWPYFPADFDPAFFQAAPARLRCDHLRGDEPFRIDGVRPEGKSFSGTLPGVRARAFAVRRSGDPFEVVLRLDTVLFDTDAAQVFLTWRGSFELERSGDEIDRVVVLREELGAPRGVAEIAARLTAISDPVLAAEPPPDTEGRGARAAKPASSPLRFGEHRRVLASVAVTGSFAARSARAASLPPARQPPPPPPKGEIEKLVADGKSLRERDLSGADLSGIDLSRQDLSGVILARAKLAGARFTAANLVGANLADIDAPDTTWDEADLSRADLTRARLPRASFQRAKLNHATLAGATLGEARLDEVAATGADFSGASLSRCRAEGAHFEKANLSGASLDAVSLRRATLDDANLYEANGAGAQIDEASLADARFEKATFAGASFRGAAARGAVWELADLSRAVLRGADVTGAIFTGARLVGADLGGVLGRTATFREADLSRATLDGADLMQASFEGACLDGASLKGANLYQAEVGGASLAGVDLTMVLVAGTKLEK